MSTKSRSGSPPAKRKQPLTTDSGTSATTADDRAGKVGATVKDKTTEVAGAAGEQAKRVAEEARVQAGNVLGQARSQLTEQATVQKGKATSELRTVGNDLRAFADGTFIGQPAPALSQVARTASETIDGLAGWLETRQPADLVTELRGFGRRKPGTFLLGAALAGVLAGRLTRGVVDANRSQGDQESSGFGLPDGRGSFADDPAATSAWPGPAGTTRTGTAVGTADPDVVTVDVDPFGPDPQRSVRGGDRR